ncbi:T9SS type A sorting domain-containing protein [Aquimarina aggregata]|uniref:T9SS type A sorting domain-containing protein n=1 Tax=Aquimarina aggregata TaxID=1642818 RepID=UPI002491BB84|nr:T9SS type A sorting domain-containing protein [Aquimarina aggregata]
MKTLNLWGTLLLALCLTQYNNAQTYGPDCNEKTSIAKAYVPYLNNLTTALKKEIIQDLAACVASGDTEAAAISYTITLEIATTATQIAQALTFLEETANAGSIDAQQRLGLYYKTTTGSIDLDKSLHYFKLAAAQNDEFSKYAVGYFKLKGLAGENQNYTSALQSFATSTHPMARHWEGICNFWGYGLPENKEKGRQILKANKIINSQELFKFIDSNAHTLFIHRRWREDRKIQDLDYINQFSPDLNNVTLADFFTNRSDFSGTLLEYDWSGQKVNRARIINASTNTRFTDKPLLSLGDRNNRINIEGDLLNNTFTTINSYPSTFKLLYPDYLDSNQREQLSKYDVSKITFNLIQSTLDPTKKALVGKVEGTIDAYNEPIPALYVILKNDDLLSRNATALVQNSPAILENQITKPIITKVSPNPFKELFTVHYGIIQKEKIQLKVFNTLGNLVRTTKVLIKEKGMHSQSFEGSDLPTGIYAVHLVIDGLLQNRFTLIKE